MATLKKQLAEERAVGRDKSRRIIALGEECKELRERLRLRDAVINEYRKRVDEADKDLAILRNLERRAQIESSKTACLVRDLQLLEAQGADTLCGSRWMNAKGFHLALQRYAEGI